MSITYKGHVVYVVTNAYPNIGTRADIVRPAGIRDLGYLHLGVINAIDSVLPLSEHERGEVIWKYQEEYAGLGRRQAIPRIDPLATGDAIGAAFHAITINYAPGWSPAHHCKPNQGTNVY